MSYISVVNYGNEIHCWDRDEHGVLDYSIHHEPMYLFVRNKQGGDYKSIYGEPMDKREFPSRTKMQQFIKENKHRVAESDVQPIYRFLLDNYLEATTTPYNVSFFDIEVDFDLEDGLGYPSIQNPFGEINSISIYDCHLKSYIMLIPKHLKGKIEVKDERDGLPVETFWCPNERDMLLTLAECLDHVDIISAYNGDAFDIPYIMERSIKCFGEHDAARMFCRNGIPATKREFVNEYGEETWEWKLAGRTHLDMMKLFKKFHPGEKKSFALDAVCEEELGEGKVSYEDNLGELYRENPQKFYDYSLHDSRLLKMLDEKKQIIKLAMLMIRSGCITPYDIHGSIKLIEMELIKYCRQNGNVVVPDRKEHNKDEQYAGAVVYDSIQGLHKWVASYDAISLYPKTMILLGLSPETMLFQAKNGYEDYVAIIEKDDSYGDIELVDVMDGEKVHLSPSELNDVIREEGYTISGNGTIFGGQLGFMSAWLSEKFQLRSKYKSMMKECYKKGDMDGGDMYNMYQLVTKILLNGTYGASGNVYFRFYDIRLAESTTITSQLISKNQAYAANEAVKMMVH